MRHSNARKLLDFIKDEKIIVEQVYFDGYLLVPEDKMAKLEQYLIEQKGEQ